MAKVTTPAFDIVNAQPNKQPVLVLEIEGVPLVFGSAPIYTTINYDDPDVFYDGTYVYDGLRPLGSTAAMQAIDLAGSNASFGQKVEQWDGRSSIEVLSLKLLDVNGYLTKLLTPGLLIDDIMNKKVTVYYGFTQISYPQDYMAIYRGYINSVADGAGFVTFGFTDPGSKRKPPIFNGNSTVLTQPLFGQKQVDFDITHDLVELSNHGFSLNAQVRFFAINGVLYPPLDPSTTYYVVNPLQDTFQIALTPSGSPIDITNYPVPPVIDPTYYVQNASQTTVQMASTSGLYETITNAFGVNDDSVVIGIVINGSEIATYVNADIQPDGHTILNVVRGAYGTPMGDYDVGTTVECFISLSGNPFDIALKTQLSGWDGPYLTGLPIYAILLDPLGAVVPDSFTFPEGVDAVSDYGMSPGSFVTLSGDPNPANNGIFTVADFANQNRTVIIEEKGILVLSTSAGPGNISTVAAPRSQYDVYPIQAGMGLSADDVFVTQWETLRDYFVPYIYEMRLYGVQADAKQWLELKLLRPIGAYTLSQNAQLSVGITHPPLGSDLTQTLDETNVKNPGGIVVNRGLNDRFFYNTIQFNYDYDPIADAYLSQYIVVDEVSIDRMGQVSSLQLDTPGLYTSNQSDVQDTMGVIANRLLQRYHYAAETIDLDVFFEEGCQMDAGDVVVLTDSVPPTLQIANTLTGVRGIYNRIMEVQERKVNLSQGSANLSLLSNNGFAFTDRYGVVAPNSKLDPAFTQTTSRIRYIDADNLQIPGTEYQKWKPYDGSFIKVFNPDFTQVGVSAYTLDSADPYVMLLDPPLGFVPNSTFLVGFEDYDSNPLINALVKATFCHWDSTAPIASGSSSSVFTLQAGYGTRYQSGAICYVMSPDGSRFSPDVKILTVIGDIVTIGPIYTAGDANLGFTPQAGDLMQLGGFPDGGNSYRLI